jgi:hypothetical protein
MLNICVTAVLTLSVSMIPKLLGCGESLVVAQAISCRRQQPEFNPRSVHVGFVVDNMSLVYVFYWYSGFPVNSSSITCSTSLIYHPGLVKWATYGLRTKGLSLTPVQEQK